MTRRIRNSALVVAGVWLATALGSVQAVSQSEAEAIAARTGEIIGGASVCGVAEGELIALGAKVIRWARDTAQSAAELKQAQAAHEAAVQRAADRVARQRASTCEATVRTFRELERKMQ